MLVSSSMHMGERKNDMKIRLMWTFFLSFLLMSSLSTNAKQAPGTGILLEPGNEAVQSSQAEEKRGAHNFLGWGLFRPHPIQSFIVQSAEFNNLIPFS